MLGKFRPITVVEGVAVGLGALFGFGLFGRSHWLLDLFSHFRAQYAAGLFLCGAVLLICRRRRLGAISLGGGLVLGITLLPWPMPRQTASDRDWKIITFNVHASNNAYHEVREFLLRENADLVLLQEINREWLEEIRTWSTWYPYRVVAPWNGRFGLVLLSRHPFLREEIHRTKTHRRDWIEAEVEMDGIPVLVAGVHGAPPTGRIASGFSPTWSRFTPWALPLDHILVGGGLALVSRKIGPALGSDHHPVIVKIAPPQP